MKQIGLGMVGLAIAMVVFARPRNDKVVNWLDSERRQWAYTMAMILLLTVGGAFALHY
jgi:hypothetical protein